MPFKPRPTPFQSARQVRQITGLGGLQAIAAAALLCATLTHHGAAQALALGRVVVQSALGEPLRAEIEVPTSTPKKPPAFGWGWLLRKRSAVPAWK